MYQRFREVIAQFTVSSILSLKTSLNIAGTLTESSLYSFL